MCSGQTSDKVPFLFRNSSLRRVEIFLPCSDDYFRFSVGIFHNCCGCCAHIDCLFGRDSAEPLLEDWGPRQDSDAAIYAALARSRTIFHTPTTTGTLRQLDNELTTLTTRVNACIDQHERRDQQVLRIGLPHYVELLVVDEAERLSPSALEHLRDRFDRQHFGLLLIGMPGIEKRLARYPQLYSRIGFAHQYRPLSDDELAHVLTRHWHKLGLTLDLTDFTDAQAVAAVGRITRGNFRLIHRLFVQIERVMRINDLAVITSDVVEAARSTLVIGDT